MMRLSAEMASAMISLTAIRLADAVDELSRLDAVAGDGDHGVNMAAAFAAADTRISNDHPTTAANVFLLVSQAFRETGGGSAGALFGVYFAAVSECLTAEASPNTKDFSEALAYGSRRVSELGRSGPGDKTMLDALLPAAVGAQMAVTADGDMHALLAAAAAAAGVGAKSTIDMVARCGRARYSDSGAVGTADPGARSVAIMFDAWENAMEERVI